MATSKRKPAAPTRFPKAPKRKGVLAKKRRRRSVATSLGRAVGRFFKAAWAELGPKEQRTGSGSGGRAGGSGAGARAAGSPTGRARGASQPGRNESWEQFLARRPDIAAQIAGRGGADGGGAHPGAATWRQRPAPGPHDQDRHDQDRRGRDDEQDSDGEDSQA